jgi:hypothetical protein
MFAIVQDFGLPSVNVVMVTESETAARAFAVFLRDDVPAHTWTMHHADAALDYWDPRQIGEEFPMWGFV